MSIQLMHLLQGLYMLLISFKNLRAKAVIIHQSFCNNGISLIENIGDIEGSSSSIAPQCRETESFQVDIKLAGVI